MKSTLKLCLVMLYVTNAIKTLGLSKNLAKIQTEKKLDTKFGGKDEYYERL